MRAQKTIAPHKAAHKKAFGLLQDAGISTAIVVSTVENDQVGVAMCGNELNLIKAAVHVIESIATDTGDVAAAKAVIDIIAQAAKYVAEENLTSEKDKEASLADVLRKLGNELTEND